MGDPRAAAPALPRVPGLLHGVAPALHQGICAAAGFGPGDPDLESHLRDRPHAAPGVEPSAAGLHNRARVFRVAVAARDLLVHRLHPGQSRRPRRGRDPGGAAGAPRWSGTADLPGRSHPARVGTSPGPDAGRQRVHRDPRRGAGAAGVHHRDAGDRRDPSIAGDAVAGAGVLRRADRSVGHRSSPGGGQGRAGGSERGSSARCWRSRCGRSRRPSPTAGVDP